MTTIHRPQKNVQLLGTIVAITIFVALQLVSKSLNIDGGKVFRGQGRLLQSRDTPKPDKAPYTAKGESAVLVASPMSGTTSQGHFTQVLETLAVQPRAFDPWPLDRPLPCFPPDGIMVENGPVFVRHDHPVKKGFFFTKTFKTGSSTSAGVNLRIARNVARRQRRDFDFCRSRYDHGTPWKFHGATLFGNRTIEQSFLWAILRDPTKRAVSLFFHFKVSRFEWEPNDANFIKAMRENNSKKNNYVRTLSLRPFFDEEHDGIEFANRIIQDYDFIGVTERIDEVCNVMTHHWCVDKTSIDPTLLTPSQSFVALAMILRIPLSDVLYLSAKMNGGYDDHCFFIQPSSLTTGMKTYLESDEWKETIQEDLELYKAANRSLDMTIDRLGRAQFESNLAQYKAALKEANDRCRDRTVFPCTKDGDKVPAGKTDCLWSDAGCGAICLDEVATDMQLDDEFWNPPGKREQLVRIAQT